MKDLGFYAIGDHVIIRCEAAREGEEVRSESGFVLEVKRQQGEIPLFGTVVSVGERCPNLYKELVGMDVALPQAGHFAKFYDPAVIRKEKKAGKGDIIYISTHYNAIRGVYTHKDKE